MASKKKKKARTSFPAGRPTAPLVDEKKNKKKGKAKPAPKGQPWRETVESLVIAFALAFLFRTFLAEAFVIPTGSMAPTLMGGHKDFVCSVCGQRCKVNASNENPENLPTDSIEGFPPGTPAQVKRMAFDTASGLCSSCRYPTPLANQLPEQVMLPGVAQQDTPTYSGDRILVNKYIYSFSEPERWDVVVFKYPGDATRNYIKRLVGLPNEELQLAGGDVYISKEGDNKPKIARKPPDKMLAMRQLVHDTDHDPAFLRTAGWPLRWQMEEASGWKVDETTEGQLQRQVYSAKAGDTPTWIRYEHTPADESAWRAALAGRQAAAATPQLVTDFNGYNTEVLRAKLGRNRQQLSAKPEKQGLHWVGDLMVEANVRCESSSGELLLELVEAGRHYRCTIDLASGKATLAAYEFESSEPIANFAPAASTSLRGSGSYTVRFANFDDELTLWVDDEVVAFDQPTTTPAQDKLAPPKTSTADLGDLAPASMGARNATVEINRLQLFRDLYYIAVTADRPNNLVDIPHRSNFEVGQGSETGKLWDIAKKPSLWPLLAERNTARFTTDTDQFFVMGDNSAASKDCRLWDAFENRAPNKPGGPYLERKLLIGKAVCVYWPHSWNRVPGTPIPFPLFPNFADMRLVR